MHVVFSVDQTINQNKLRKTAQICEAHCCRFFPFFFLFIPGSSEEILRLSFLIIRHSYTPF